jgi:hypothetical protein
MVNLKLTFGRWLLDNDHDEEGMVVIANLYGGGDIHDHKARDEYREIKMNVLLQRQEGERTYLDMFRRYGRRVFIAMSAQGLAQLNGINVISYYAPYVGHFFDSDAPRRCAASPTFRDK